MPTFAQHLGDGSTRTFAVPCLYIAPAHIVVKIGGFPCTLGAHYDFLNDSTIQIRPQFTPAAGTTVELRRQTPTTELVTYQNGAVLSADDLNTATIQSLFISEELKDYYEATVVAGFNRLNTGTAVTAQEAIDAAVQDVLNSALLASLQDLTGDIFINGEAIAQIAVTTADLQSQINAIGVIDGVGIGTLIVNEQNARVAGDQALVDTIALIGAKNGAGTAFIADLNKLMVGPTESLATRFTAISAANAANAAAVATEATARSNADSALASSISVISASNAANAAAITTEATARASGDSSLASSVTSLSSTVGSHTASISSQLTSINGLSAQYAIRINVDGHVSGFGLASGAGGTSEFIVLANKFSIVDPSNGANVKVPFTVSGGVVYMQNVVIGNAIIADLSIGKLTNGTLNADMAIGTGRISWSNGSYMKVTGVGFGSSNQFIEWYGPYFASFASCTEANAISYLKANGSAYFGGTLHAGTLNNAGTGTLLTSTAQVVVGPFHSNGANKAITFSYSLGASGTGLNSRVPASPGTTSNPSVTITLYRSVNGGGETTVATQNLTGTSGSAVDGFDGYYYFNKNMSGSFSITDTTATSGNYTYRLAISSLNLGSNVDTSGGNAGLLPSGDQQRLTITSVE